MRNLVEFILRHGDIDNRNIGSQDQNAMQEGSRLHRKIQGRMGSSYTAEVPLSFTATYKEFRIVVEGRADGVIEEQLISGGPDVFIDEIKCMYQNVKHITEPFLLHKAQAMCYACMYGLIADLSSVGTVLTYCNIETEEIKRFRDTYNIEELREWFLGLVNQYSEWITFLHHHLKDRQASIAGVEFPFAYRKGQRKLVVSVYRAISQKERLYIQAPTGIGKTISTIFPAVAAMGQEKCQRIFYLTAKTITRTVAQESFDILSRCGVRISTIAITAKEKICPQDETECNPVTCERARGHFDRINEAVYDVITHEFQITRQTIEEYAKKHNVCPYEMSLDISVWVDGIICDYNYAFDPVVKLKRFFSDATADGANVFLIDEAHNLVDRAREMYSAELYREEFVSIIHIMEFQSVRVTNALKKCQKIMTHLKRQSGEYEYLDTADINSLILALMRLYGELDEYLHEYTEFDMRKDVLEFYFRVGNFLNIYELVDDNYRVFGLHEGGRFLVKLLCINPSKNLRECMKKSISTIFFSATMLPILYYKKLLSGEESDYAIYVDSPFEADNRLLMIGGDVTSKYTRRGESEYKRILTYVKEAYDARPGNYMIFFPSYQLLENVYEMFAREQEDRKVLLLLQKPSMDESEREEFIRQFDLGEPVIAFCVLGGIFSEGIDLTEEKLIGCFVVGTGLPQICVEREILKNYFDEHGENGFDYAYRYPGMNKVMQAAGRVIRTMSDRGIIGLLDYRFLEGQYQRLFPREWEHHVVVTAKNAKEVMLDFWEK